MANAKLRQLVSYRRWSLYSSRGNRAVGQRQTEGQPGTYGSKLRRDTSSSVNDWQDQHVLALAAVTGNAHQQRSPLMASLVCQLWT